MITSQLLSRILSLTHGFSDRTDGNMSIKASEIQHKMTGEVKNETYENRQRFLSGLGVKGQDLILSRQTHNTVVEQVNLSHKGKSERNESPFTSADGLITQEKQTYLAIFTADCLPIFFVDPVTRTIAAVHAGWRGLIGGILPKTVERMSQQGVGSANVVVWIGPHIQACHYRLDRVAPSYREKIDAFGDKSEYIVRRGNDQFLDLTALAVRQLLEQGISREQIEVGECTACYPEKYYSYYTDQGKLSGIMMGVIGWKE